MNFDFEKLKMEGLLGASALEFARIHETRASWRAALAQSDLLSKQLDQLSGEGTAVSQILKDVKALQSPAMRIVPQYKDILGESSFALQTVQRWQEAQKAQDESIRKMIEPLADIRKSLMLDTVTQKIIKDFTGLGSITNQIKDALNQVSGIGSVAELWAKEIEQSRTHTQKILENVTLGNTVESYLKEFEQINKNWQVPGDVTRILNSVKDIQEQLGVSKLALPTIDWG